MPGKYVIILGPAGSGKTTLVNTLSEWLNDQEISNSKINLDPAVDILPYAPDVDVRKFVNAKDVALRYELGPNGALLASMDLLYAQAERIKDEILHNEKEYNIVDTPGQLELFAFRSTGPLLVEKLTPKDSTTVVFLIDANFTLNIENFLSIILLAYSVRLRHSYPQINVITKIDMLEPETVERLQDLKDEPEKLKELIEESRLISRNDFALSLAETIVERGLDYVMVSSVTNEGIDELFSHVQHTLSDYSDIETNVE